MPYFHALIPHTAAVIRKTNIVVAGVLALLPADQPLFLKPVHKAAHTGFLQHQCLRNFQLVAPVANPQLNQNVPLLRGHVQPYGLKLAGQMPAQQTAGGIGQKTERLVRVILEIIHGMLLDVEGIK